MRGERVITYGDFQKLEIRVGKIEEAVPVEGAENLLKLKINIGKEEAIQTAAGIAKFYKIEELIGKLVIVLVNLEPKTIRGVESKGMLLAAVEEGKISLLQPDKELAPGTEVK